ncbi:class I SAM-dependent methyltransferase [Acidiferrobacter sp. SPIII_3]|jgi:SAM-dependent methyltransferase|uniref:class I SAM-dependent methyltransferase n=1 Tax=Acidiferrobacter sp. SPIII_3 TaxID=1281578 RepID=UPI00197AB658|nr:class I SAM-dependent methyltransferase [Acidiferrobacter sp. SPIII_3]
MYHHKDRAPDRRRTPATAAVGRRAQGDNNEEYGMTADADQGPGLAMPGKTSGGHGGTALTEGAASYDAWYDSPRGRWIGTTEFELLAVALGAREGETLLDVGCGSGWFTRRFARRGLAVTGLDVRGDWLSFARAQPGPAGQWVAGDARALPFADEGFDHVVSIAALCFISDERRAVAEIVRVTRRRFAIGWLNRTSLLYRAKGREGGQGAYRGARWHDAGEVKALFSGMAVREVSIRSAVFLPSAGPVARLTERMLPQALPLGALIVACGEKRR